MTTLFSSKKYAIGYGLLLLLAVILRLFQLNVPMLSEFEASIAMNAAGVTVNAAPGTSGMISLIAPILFVFGKNEIAARLLTALFGTAVIFAPLFFTRMLGNKTAIAMTILIMFDPAITAYSRQVNGAVVSLWGALFAAGFLINRRYIGAGIAAGIALMASPEIWPSLLAVGLALWLVTRRDAQTSGDEVPWQFSRISKSEWITAAVSLIITIGLFGSAFLTRLIGVSSPFTNIFAYLQGWAQPGSTSAGLMLFSFILYQPFVLIAGLVEGFIALRRGDWNGRFLLIWFVISLILSLIYPSRSFASLVFTCIPLLTLSAGCIVRIIGSTEKPDMPAFGQMTLTILLIPFSWMNILAVTFPIEGQEEALRMAAAAGGLLLLVIATILIHMGWPSKQGRTGLWMGLAVLLSVMSLSAAWRSAGLAKNPEAEMWNYNGITSELDLLQRTAGDISEWNVASRTGINIVILNYPSAALKWALRDFTSVNDARSLPSLSNPAIVITANEEVPSLSKAYRGQDFALSHQTSWDLILPEEWIKWFALREAPSSQQIVILWARTDLFPGAEKTAPAAITPVE